MEHYWATCPKCGADLIYSKFHYSDYDENVVNFVGEGHCPCCKKHWEWEEQFILSEIGCFKDVTPKENEED